MVKKYDYILISQDIIKFPWTFQINSNNTSTLYPEIHVSVTCSSTSRKDTKARYALCSRGAKHTHTNTYQSVSYALSVMYYITCTLHRQHDVWSCNWNVCSIPCMRSYSLHRLCPRFMHMLAPYILTLHICMAAFLFLSLYPVHSRTYMTNNNNKKNAHCNARNYNMHARVLVSLWRGARTVHSRFGSLAKVMVTTRLYTVWYVRRISWHGFCRQNSSRDVFRWFLFCGFFCLLTCGKKFCTRQEKRNTQDMSQRFSETTQATEKNNHYIASQLNPNIKANPPKHRRHHGIIYSAIIIQPTTPRGMCNQTCKCIVSENRTCKKNTLPFFVCMSSQHHQ